MLLTMKILNLILLQIIYFVLFFTKKASCQVLYIGCYADLPGLYLHSMPFQSVSQCVTQCRSQTYPLAAIKNGLTCYCGNMLNTRVSSSNCNPPCMDNGGTCGGNNYYAVYTGVPTYLGCFDDYRDRGLNGTGLRNYGFTMTLDECFRKCSSKNYRYTGFQFEGYCFCGQQYGKYGRVPETECDRSCSGDRSRICGRPYRNSVYSIGYIDGLNKNYAEVFHCLSGNTDMYGTCINITCQPGWKGSSCNQRDCLLNNGYCGEHKCEEFKIGNINISECVCKEGYKSNSIYDECTDINECDSNPCNNETSTCNNNIGSYDCICYEGFVRNPNNNKQCSQTCIEEYQNNDRKIIIILATFLGLLICALTISILVNFYCRNKHEDLGYNVQIQNQTKTSNNVQDIHTTYDKLDFSNQSHDEHNYSDLKYN